MCIRLLGSRHKTLIHKRTVRLVITDMTVAVLTKVGEVSGSSRQDFTDECAKVSDERVISVGTAGFSTSIVKLYATISTNKPVQQ